MPYSLSVLKYHCVEEMHVEFKIDIVPLIIVFRRLPKV